MVEWVRNIASKGVKKMSILAIVGFILAVINPVIGGVLVGYLVWLNDPNTGFQIMMLR